MLVCNTAAIEITLDFSLDEHNLNWFGDTPEGVARRGTVLAAAEFLSAIITNDDWNAVDISGRDLSFNDIAIAQIQDFSGQPVSGTPEADGAGYTYTLPVSNRSLVATNEYVLYVGALPFDNATSGHAKASWDGSDRRNAAGVAGAEFNTWGGKLYFDASEPWYAGWTPGLNPTDNYGIQDANKNPGSDSNLDNWDWSTASDSWKGFQLSTVDLQAIGKLDLYATALHEMMHALGATSSIMDQYLLADSEGNFHSSNLISTYGGPVPGAGGHFDENVQSAVWNSADILSEATLDPNSLAGVRKYLTQLDVALLRDLGYEVLDSLALADFDGNTLVDDRDLQIWQSAFALNSQADATGDLISSGLDFLTWQREFSSAELSNDLTLIPEPPALMLFCAGALGCVSIKSRALS